MSEFWDQRYQDSVYVYGESANWFLKSIQSRLKPGMSALSVADGEGRNGVWLAEQGLLVTTVDFSARGLEKTRALAARRNVHVTTLQRNVLTWDWPVATFDLVVAIFIHFKPTERQTMHLRFQQALRPGGLLVIVAFSPQQLDFGTGGPPQLELLYTREMLAEDLKGMHIVHLGESTEMLDEGLMHQGLGATVHALAVNCVSPASIV